MTHAYSAVIPLTHAYLVLDGTFSICLVCSVALPISGCSFELFSKEKIFN